MRFKGPLAYTGDDAQYSSMSSFSCLAIVSASAASKKSSQGFAVLHLTFSDGASDWKKDAPDDGNVDLVEIHESQLLLTRPVLRTDWPAAAGLVVEDHQTLLSIFARQDSGHGRSRSQHFCVSREVDVRVDVDERVGHRVTDDLEEKRRDCRGETRRRSLFAERGINQRDPGAYRPSPS